MSDDTILECRSVSKSFGRLKAVDGVSLRVARGSIFGIAGPNGAGKTTLFNLISGIPFQADAGQILLDGRDIRTLPAHQICKHGLARTFQTEAAFDALTVEENVRIGAVFGGRSRNVRDMVDHALAYVELEDQRHRMASALPLHAKKRLMIASAIACRPEVLLLDEPAAGLNQAEYQQIEELIRRLNGEGMTIVLIEHVLPLLLSVSQRVLVMNSGSVVAVAPPKEIIANDDVITAYLGERGRRLAHAQG